MHRDITEQEYENVLDLCESLPVSSRASERLFEQYFGENAFTDKMAAAGSAVGKGAKGAGGAIAKAMKALAGKLYQKNKPTVLIAQMVSAIDEMIKGIKGSQTMESTPQIAQQHIAMLEEYKAKILAKQEQAIKLEAAQAEAEVAAKTATATTEGGEQETPAEGEETANEEGAEGTETSTETPTEETESPEESKVEDTKEEKEEEPGFGEDGGELGESLESPVKPRV